MNVLSLFSGIGGLDLGLEAHCCTTVAYSEIDKYAAEIMALRFPDAVNIGDITAAHFEVNADGTTYIERGDGEGFWLPPIDIIAGGFPCQDISSAGTKEGIGGRRSGLWGDMHRAIRELRPAGILVENVSALLARGIDRVLGDLATSGYDAEWDCIPAGALGAPHLRDRVFLVAYGSVPGGGYPSAPFAPLEHEPDPDTDGPGFGEQRGAGSVPTEHVAAECRGEAAANAVLERAQVPDQGRHAAVSEPWGEGGPWGPWPQPAGQEWWVAEPDVGRVVDGLPRRVDRLKCLGNAVVPQVAEHVAGILIDRMERVS